MNTKRVTIPEGLLKLLERSRLSGRPEADQVRAILAIHLFQEGIISIGKAAEWAGENRADFEMMLIDMGIPVVRYGMADLEEDLRNLATIEQWAKDR